VQTQADAERRKKEVRARLLTVIGALPDKHPPLNVRVTGQISRGAYVIEKVIFDSRPGFSITANVYRPSHPGRKPGILLPMGHSEQGKAAEQRIAANLALKGFVVLVYDPIGQGERRQAYDVRLGAALAGGVVEQHLIAGAQSLLAGQTFAFYCIWDARRALDYLASRTDVDSARIGCTGCSGGGTLTTYISAIDPRVKVAAPACYINTYRFLFAGPTGDSEQSLPNFLSSGLDLPDYIEQFAPKPWLIGSTRDDFFPLDGARMAYEEARRIYGLYNASGRIKWAIGPGEHGTPLEVREAIYGWMIRWLKNGDGDSKEQSTDLLPDYQLNVTAHGQLSDSRDVYQLILEHARDRSHPASIAALREELRRIAAPRIDTPPVVTIVSETETPPFTRRHIQFETEPGLNLEADLLIPYTARDRTAVLSVETARTLSPIAERVARDGHIVLALIPRSDPASKDSWPFSGDWITNSRAALIGRNLPGMRIHDIQRGLDVLAMQPSVEASSIRAIASDVAGIWLLMAAAIDQRLAAIWLNRTPYSLRSSLETPLPRNLHDAVIPGFALHWDLDNVVKAMEGRKVVWTDPTDWTRTISYHSGRFLYRYHDEPDDRYIDALLK
jgi:hypothetical protein